MADNGVGREIQESSTHSPLNGPASIYNLPFFFHVILDHVIDYTSVAISVFSHVVVEARTIHTRYCVLRATPHLSCKLGTLYPWGAFVIHMNTFRFQEA